MACEALGLLPAAGPGPVSAILESQGLAPACPHWDPSQLPRATGLQPVTLQMGMSCILMVGVNPRHLKFIQPGWGDEGPQAATMRSRPPAALLPPGTRAAAEQAGGRWLPQRQPLKQMYYKSWKPRIGDLDGDDFIGLGFSIAIKFSFLTRGKSRRQKWQGVGQEPLVLLGKSTTLG